MNDSSDNQQAVTLCQLGNYLKRVVDDADIKVWVVGEILSINVNRHCYIELVERSEETGTIIARMRMNIWQNNLAHIFSTFHTHTGKNPEAGMKIMAFASVKYSEIYGINATITAINASYTIGDMEMTRRLTIQRLQADGVIDMNKTLTLPRALQNIAVISSESAAGYGDFCNQMANSPIHFRIQLKLYPATMQGDSAATSIIEALDRIAAEETSPDVVIIIRGGGSRADLICFDDYELASNIAQFPHPILTGIGHERDTSVADIVAHTQIKTPTAVAEYIISHNNSLLDELNRLSDFIRDIANNKCQMMNNLHAQLSMVLITAAKNNVARRLQKCERLQDTLKTTAYSKTESIAQRCNMSKMQLRITANNILKSHTNKIDRLRIDIERTTTSKLRTQQLKLDQMQKIVEMHDPKHTLSRGYTITTSNGVRITSSSQVASGSTLNTLTADGWIESIVK